MDLYAPNWLKKILRSLIQSGSSLGQKLGAGAMRFTQALLERRHARMRRELIKMDRRLGDVLAFTGPME
jgi:hypothetical protein